MNLPCLTQRNNANIIKLKTNTENAPIIYSSITHAVISLVYLTALLSVTKCNQ